jgi:hypothetical protein
MTTKFSPECRLVFRTAGPSAAYPGTTDLARDEVDWRRVLYIAEKEVAGAALWRALERVGEAAVPPDVAAHLRRHAMVSDFRMMHLSERLQRTVRMFREHGVPVMLLKGAAIGALSDPTFRSRPMNDIDLLVRREDVDRALAAVVAAGWPPNEDPLLSDLMRDHHHLPPFFDQRIPDLRLELHVGLLPPGRAFQIDEAEFWAAASPAKAPFEGATVPSAEHLLLHACMHFAWSHTMHFGAWRTMRLANSLVETGLVDWERFIALAGRVGCESSCYWTLRLAHRLGGVPVPAVVLDRLAVPPQEWLRGALERFFVADIATGEGPPSPSLRVTRFLWRLALRPAPGTDEVDGHWKHDPRWARSPVVDVASETTPARLVRHARGIRRWWNFARRTLVSPD